MSEINKLNDKKLKAIHSVARDKEVTMADGKGLSIRVSKLGNISWVYSYRLGGRESTLERISLGTYPDVGLKSAREKRDECRAWLADGVNPKVKLKTGKDELLSPVTVKDALEYWVNEYALTHRTDGKAKRDQFEKHIYPYIGNLPLKDVETRHWLTCLDRTKKKFPVAAGMVFAAAKQALKFCRIRRYAESDVLEFLTINDVGKTPNKKDRVLTDSEIRDLLRSIDSGKISPYHAKLIKLLLVFGCRTHEIRVSTWKEWDFNEMIWTVPAANSKTGVKIIRPIPERIAKFLKPLSEGMNLNDPVLAEIKRGETVSQVCRGIWKRLRHNESWTLHDLRRTFSTKLNDLGQPPHVVEQMLGHTMGGVMAIYNRSQYLPEKRQALEIWLDRLELLASDADNVTILKDYAAS